MHNMVYVALSILALAATVLFVWMLHAAWVKKLSAVLANLGLLSLVAFAIVVLAIVGTATGSAFVASFTATVGTWALAVFGIVSLVLSVTITGVLRSTQAWRFRHDQSKATRLDKRARRREKQQEIKQNSSQFIDEHSSPEY